jgi:arylsulfatase A-like enzyme
MQSNENEYGGVIGRTYKESKPWWPERVKAPPGSPNIVFIILDDVGFSQLGCYGSEIETPNMDRLAQNGLIYNNFHTTALCSPTRACLLTGRNHHSVGTGIITNLSTGYPGYNARIPSNAATVAHVLKDNGYNTMAVGKWHNTPSEELSAAGPFDRWPLGMGFERFYGFLAGETNQWSPSLTQDNHPIETPQRPGYHVTEDIIDQSIKYVLDQKQAGSDNPFLLWQSFGAAHAPHHAPQEFIDKYKGKFDKGWDQVREEVLARQKESGLVAPDTELAPNDKRVIPWNDLSDDQRRLFARMQEVYAGFLDHTDYHIGRFIDFLEEINELDNTLVMLISDNGASREGGPNGTVNEIRFFNRVKESLEANLEMIDELGGPLTYNHYPRGWAQAGNTPLKRYKQNTHGGGIRDPLIVHWPDGIRDKGQIRTQYHHVIDLVPTVYDIIGIDPPDEYKGVEQKPVEGVSLAYSFNNADAPTQKQVQYYEMFGHRALWHDGWKAVTYHEWGSGGNFEDDQWELYNMDTDFSECHDLADQHPEKVKKMEEMWWEEAEKYQVLPLDDRTNERFYIDKPSRHEDQKQFTYYPSTSMMTGGPPIRNRSHAIMADVDGTDDNVQGVLISHGGRFAGYSLFVHNKRLIYDHNFLGIEHYRVVSDIEIPTGASRLGFVFEKTGEHQGVGQLYIDGKKVGEGAIDRTIPVNYGPEGLEIGRDTLTPVSEDYACPFTFTGKLKKVVVSVNGEIHLDPEGDFIAAMGEQ